jgi:hypothetical protein
MMLFLPPRKIKCLSLHPLISSLNLLFLSPSHLHLFGSFTLFLPEGRAGVAWKPSNKMMLFLPPRKIKCLLLHPLISCLNLLFIYPSHLPLFASFTLFLPEGRTGVAWEPSNKMTLFLPPRKTKCLSLYVISSLNLLFIYPSRLSLSRIQRVKRSSPSSLHATICSCGPKRGPRRTTHNEPPLFSTGFKRARGKETSITWRLIAWPQMAPEFWYVPSAYVTTLNK